MRVKVWELRKALELAIGFIETNPIIPITENFLLSNDEHRLVVQAHSNDSAIRVVTDINLGQGERFYLAVPSKLLLETLKEIKVEEVNMVLDQDKTSCTIHTDAGVYKLGCEPGGGFPAFPEIGSDLVSVETSQLMAGLKATFPIASTDTFRPAFTGIYFGKNNEETALYATDGFRCVKSLKGVNDYLAGKLLSRKSAQRLGNVLDAGKPLQVSSTENKLFFIQGGVAVCSVLLQEKFPDCEQIITMARQGVQSATIDRASLIGSLNRVSVFSKQDAFVKFDFEADLLKVFSEDSVSQGLSEKIAIENFKGEPLSIFLNPRLLNEMLKVFTDKEIQIALSGQQRAVFITSEHDKLESVIMPLNKQ